MQIKRFTAGSMSQALQMIKAELGPEAIILSARSVKKNGLFLDAFRKAGVEVTAAKDAPDTQGYGQMPQVAAQGRRSVSARGRSRATRTYRPEPHRTAAAGRSAGLSVRTEKDDRLRNSWLYRHLIRQDVWPEYALEIAAELLADAVVETFGDEHLLTALDRAVRRLGVDTRPCLSSGPKRMALIGPSGAGKTASAAKIAAVRAMQANRQVALISLDNYRIAGTDQLKRCTEIIGIPLAAAGGPDQLKQALCRFETADLVLIDTPALRPDDAGMLARLRDDLKLAEADEIHFVCSASCKEKDTLELFEALKGIAVNRLLFTKLDETGSYGNLLNLLVQLQLPASGFSSGQQVPGSLENASVGKLVELILNGRSAAAAEDASFETRQAKRVAAGRRRNAAEAPFTANKNSYLFHTADCNWTRLIKADNRVAFKSVAEALARKFKPCRDCCKAIAEPQEIHRWDIGVAKASAARAAAGLTKKFSERRRPESIPVRSA